MGSEQIQTIPLINSTSNNKHAVQRYFGDVNRDNIILNSIFLTTIYIISMYFSFYINWSTNNFSILSLALYSFYSIPICFFAPIVVAKLRVKYTLFGVIILSCILYFCEIYANVGFVTVVSLILAPILTELLYISIGSYIISFSTKENIGLVFGIFTGIPFIISNLFSLYYIQYGDFIVIGLVVFVLSMVLIFILGCNSSDSNCNNENIEEANGLFTIMSVIGCDKFIYFVPAAIYIGCIFDYSIILTYVESSYDHIVSIFTRYFFVVGIIGGISAISFGILSDKLCKSVLLKITLAFGIVGFLINFIVNVGIENYETRFSVNVTEKLNLTSLTFGYFSSSSLIVLIYVVGSLCFKKNSISFVASVRLFQSVGSIITLAFQYWTMEDLKFNLVLPTYLLPLIFIIGCISLTVLISKRINNNHHVGSSGGYSQIV